MANPKQRCRDVSEPGSYKRLDLGPSGSWQGTYEITGQDTGCLNYMFERDEILQLGCLADKHLFFIGGSIGTGMPMNLMHILKPASYPTNAADWLGCVGPCVINADAWPTAVTFADMVIDANGNVLHMESSLTVDPVTTPNYTVDDDILQGIIDRMLAAPDAGVGGTRVTWIRSRTLKAAPHLFVALQKATSQKVGSTPLQPILYSGVQAWWYDFCRVGSSDSNLCLMQASFTQAQLVQMIKTEAANFISTVISEVPSLQRPVYFLNSRSHDWFSDALSTTFSGNQNARIMDEEDNDFTQIGFSIWDFMYDNHPENLIHMMRTQRLLNDMCSNAPSEINVAKINFNGKGCTANDRSWTDSWDRHHYQHCSFTVTNDAVPTAAITRKPTSSPVPFPTESPTSTDCVEVGTACQTAADCCSLSCSSTTNLCEVSTVSPTVSPTLPPQGGSITPVKKPALQLEVELPEHWGFRSANGNSSAQGNNGAAAPISERFFRYGADIGQIDAVDFHYAASVLSALVLLVGFLVYFASDELKDLVRSKICCCCSSKRQNGKKNSADKLEPTKPSKLDSDPVDMELGSDQSLLPLDTTEDDMTANADGVATLEESNATDSDEQSRTVVPAAAAAGTQSNETLTDGDSMASMDGGNTDKRPPLAKEIRVAQQGTSRLSKLDALGFARYLASVHIVAGHVFAKNDPGLPLIEDWYTSSFGFTWVPWFMMLSGFVLSYAQLARKETNPDYSPKPWFEFTFDRVRGIYPLYLTGLVAAAAIRSYNTSVSFSSSFGSVTEGLSSVFLLQAWIPSVTERVLQAHCWFLSCIIPYWLVHNMVLRRIETWSTSVVCVVATLLCVVPVVLLIAIPLGMGESIEWYVAHEFGVVPTTLVDYLVVVLKFFPATYFMTYFLGMVSAKLYMNVRESPPLILKFGALFGYIGIFLVFLLEGAFHWPGNKLLFRLGALGPFQSISLIGLAIGTDPLAKLFAFPLLKSLENLSYPQYVFQFIVLEIWGIYTGFGYWLVLNAVALIAYYFIQKPLRDRNSSKLQVAFGTVSMILLVLLLVGAFMLRVTDLDLTTNFAPEAPAQIVYTSSAQDVRISFEHQFDVNNPLMDDSRPSRNINPSLMWDPTSKVLRIAHRRHRYELKRTIVNNYVVDKEVLSGLVFEQRIWHADIVIGKLSVPTSNSSSKWQVSNTRSVALGLRSPMSVDGLKPWHELTCAESPLYIPANNTVSVVERLGPEDPRLALGSSTGEDGFMLTYNSLPVGPQQECEEQRRVFQADIATQVVGNSDNQASTRYASDKPYQLESQFSQAEVVEKNWVSFRDADTDELMYLQMVHPTVIVKVTGRDNAGIATVDEVTRSSFPPLKETLRLFDDIEIHGGANPILVQMTGGDKLYLGTFHTVDSKGKYMNYAFTMQPTYPYGIKHVSKPLPLIMAPISDLSLLQRMTFCSGISPLPDGRIAFAYGSSNAESRLLVLPLSEVVDLLSDADGVKVPTEGWKVLNID